MFNEHISFYNEKSNFLLKPIKQRYTKATKIPVFLKIIYMLIILNEEGERRGKKRWGLSTNVDFGIHNLAEIIILQSNRIPFHQKFINFSGLSKNTKL